MATVWCVMDENGALLAIHRTEKNARHYTSLFRGSYVVERVVL